MIRSIVTLIFFLSGFFFLNAQEKKDSLYYKIEEFSDKRKVTKFLHRFIFRREADSASVKSRTEKLPQEAYNKRYIRTSGSKPLTLLGMIPRTRKNS